MPNVNAGKPVDVSFGLEAEDKGNLTEFFQAAFGVDLGAEVTLSGVGKGKAIQIDDDRFIFTSPGLKLTLTNEDTGESITFSATGAFHDTILEDGTLVETYTGRNALGDPEIADGQPGFVLVSGNWSATFGSDGSLIQPLSGDGHLTDLLNQILL